MRRGGERTMTCRRRRHRCRRPLAAALPAHASARLSMQSFVREWFAVLNRNINTASAFLLSLFSGRSYRRTAARNAAQKQQAWHRWWQSSHGTFNALIEQEGLTSDSGTAPPTPRSPRALSVGTSSALPPNGSISSTGSRWRFWRRASSSGSGEGASLDDASSPRVADMNRGSVLFELPAGFAVFQVGPQGGAWWRMAVCARGCGGITARACLAPTCIAIPHLPPQMVSSRGLLEDLRLGTEVALGRAFGAARRLLHRVLWLDVDGDGSAHGGIRSDADSPADLLERRMRRRSMPPPAGLAAVAEEASAAAGEAAAPRRRRAKRIPLRNLLRSGRHWEDDLSVWTASDVILREGYPLEQHSVTTSGAAAVPGRKSAACLEARIWLANGSHPEHRTSLLLAHPYADGYVLQMHRIPRHGARDVAYFQHGVLDTSLGWVRGWPLPCLAAVPVAWQQPCVLPMPTCFPPCLRPRARCPTAPWAAPHLPPTTSASTCGWATRAATRRACMSVRAGWRRPRLGWRLGACVPPQGCSLPVQVLHSLRLLAPPTSPLLPCPMWHRCGQAGVAVLAILHQ